METSEVIKEGCAFIANVSCYDVAKDFIGPAFTFLAVIITIVLALHQISRQHNNTLSAQKEESKRNTRIELFKDINTLLDQTSTVVRGINSFCNATKYSKFNEVALLDHHEYLKLSQNLNQALLSVVSKIESHEIVNQKLFMTFRYSLQSIVYDVMQLKHDTTSTTALNSMIDYTSDAQCYLSDFQVCMQNLAYGEVFDTSISHRVPADKRLKVITNDPVQLDKLLNHFSTETNWGKNMTKYENEANEKYS